MRDGCRWRPRHELLSDPRADLALSARLLHDEHGAPHHGGHARQAHSLEPQALSRCPHGTVHGHGLWMTGAARPCSMARRLMQIYDSGSEVVSKIADAAGALEERRPKADGTKQSANRGK